MGYFLYFVIISVLIGVLILAAYHMYAQHLSKHSGWDHLAIRYPAESEPLGTVLNYQTLMVGSTIFNKTVSFGAIEEGLYLRSWFTKQPLLIPWYEISRGKETGMGAQKGYQVKIGDPVAGTLTLPKQLYILVQSFTERKR